MSISVYYHIRARVCFRVSVFVKGDIRKNPNNIVNLLVCLVCLQFYLGWMTGAIVVHTMCKYTVCIYCIVSLLYYEYRDIVGYIRGSFI